MKAFLASLMTVFALALTTGCATTGGAKADVPAHTDICPTCKTKLAQSGQNEKGRPQYSSVHACPGCKGSVVAVQRDGKWVHEPKDGAKHDCKMCNPK